MSSNPYKPEHILLKDHLMIILIALYYNDKMKLKEICALMDNKGFNSNRKNVFNILNYTLMTRNFIEKECRSVYRITSKGAELVNIWFDQKKIEYRLKNL